jgi:hypothetical protein
LFDFSCGLSRVIASLRYVEHLAMQQAVPGEAERVDLDLCLLVGVD